MRQPRPVILLAEDDPILSALLVEVLSEEGYAVTASADGLSALHYAIRHTPAASVLDGHMPRLDGFAFARIYDALPGPHAPVMLMTGDLAACLGSALPEGVEVLPKPFELDHLVAHIRHLVPADGTPALSPSAA